MTFYINIITTQRLHVFTGRPVDSILATRHTWLSTVGDSVFPMNDTWQLFVEQSQLYNASCSPETNASKHGFFLPLSPNALRLFYIFYKVVVLCIIKQNKCCNKIKQNIYFIATSECEHLTFGHLLSQFRLSSETFVHPTQPVKIFGTVST